MAERRHRQRFERAAVGRSIDAARKPTDDRRAGHGEHATQLTRDALTVRRRSSGADDAIRLVPPHLMGLEVAVEFINDDELVEVTPKSIRLRKRILQQNMRPRKSDD